MAFVGEGDQTYHFSFSKDSQFVNHVGEASENYTFEEKLWQVIDAVDDGIQSGLEELLTSPDELVKAAALGAVTALGIAVGGVVVAKIAVVAGAFFAIYTLIRYCIQIGRIDNKLEQMQEISKIVTENLVLFAAGWAGAKGGTAIGQHIKNPETWARVADQTKEQISSGETVANYESIFRTADDLYSLLSKMVDEDALGYLRSEYGTPTDIRQLQKVTDSIRSAKGVAGRQLNLSEIKFIHRGMLNGIPVELTEHFFKAHYGQPTGKIGDFINLQGSTIDEILSRIPYDAEYKRFKPKSGYAQKGFKFQWEGSDGKTYRLEVHDIDPSAPAGSNAASGWVVRIKRGRCYYDYTTNKFQEAKYTNQDGPYYDAVIANNTHIPIKNPYGEK